MNLTWGFKDVNLTALNDLVVENVH